MQIDPWGSSQVQDYARLRDEFGIAAFGPAEYGVFQEPHRLLRRGVVFGHRDFERVADAVTRHDPWSVMTGFMPSGDLHLGHKMVLEQVVAHQAAGADAWLCLADFEAIAARHFTPEKAKRIALDQYVHNALALGLDASAQPFYFQTRRTRVKDLAHTFAQKVNWTQLQALYGFTGDTSLAHVLAPLIQAADILHPQTDAVGPRPVLVPVGVDQDPHIRLTRDIAQAWRTLALIRQVMGPGQGEGWFIVVKGGEDAVTWLDVADRVLDELGVGTRTGRKRNDAHGQMFVGSLEAITPTEQRVIDTALARAEAALGKLALVSPSATFHRFETGLQGGKMSSSKPESSVFLTEDPKVAEKKVMSSLTGGRTSAEEQRRLGAHPEKCPVYELYLYHLAKDDSHLQEVFDTCRTGARLCGGCKKEAVGLLVNFLKDHKDKRDQVAHLVEAAVAAD